MVNNSTTNPGIDSATFADIATGAPCVLAADGREVHKVNASQALDIETESVISVGSTDPVYFASASGAVEYTRIAPPSPPTP